MRKNRRDHLIAKMITAQETALRLERELDSVLPTDSRIVASQRLHAAECPRRDKHNAACACRDTLFSQRVHVKRVKVTSSRMDEDNMCTTEHVDLEITVANCDVIPVKRVACDAFAEDIRALMR